MYSALFRKLRGGPVAKAFQFAAIVIAVICILFFFVFPMVELLIPEDPALNG